MKRFLVGIFFILGTSSVFAQDFFADEQNKDTIPKQFYENKFHGTVCYTIGLPHYWYGGSILIHYNKEKISPYVEFRYNPSTQISAEIYQKSSTDPTKSDSKMTSTMLYRVYNISVGLATSPIKDLLLYGNVGMRYQKELFDRSKYNGFYIKPKDNEVTLLYGAGALYVLPYGISVQLGVDLSKFTVISGLGLTF